VAGALS